MNNFGSRHSTCANITEGGLWRWGGKISEDFYVFVLLYNTKLMNKFKLMILSKKKITKLTVQIHYNLQYKSPHFPLRWLTYRKERRALFWSLLVYDMIVYFEIYIPPPFFQCLLYVNNTILS